jgi:hypothetical protein
LAEVTLGPGERLVLSEPVNGGEVAKQLIGEINRTERLLENVTARAAELEAIVSATVDPIGEQAAADELKGVLELQAQQRTRLENLRTRLAEVRGVATPQDAPAPRSPAQAERDATRDIVESADHMQRIAVAIHQYYQDAGHLPPASAGLQRVMGPGGVFELNQGGGRPLGGRITGRITIPAFEDGPAEWQINRPYLSWRVLILGYLGEGELLAKFRFDEPWDSEHNRALIDQMPDVYRAPGSTAGPGKTNYLGLSGPNAAFPPGEPIQLAAFTDGFDTTLLVVEAPDAAAIEWTRPSDFSVEPPPAASDLVGLRDGGFLAAWGGSYGSRSDVTLISSDIPTAILARLIRRNDLAREETAQIRRLIPNYGREPSPEELREWVGDLGNAVVGPPPTDGPAPPGATPRP